MNSKVYSSELLSVQDQTINVVKKIAVRALNRRSYSYRSPILLSLPLSPVLTKATITRCDLSPRFFCIDATSLCEFESDKI